MSQTLSHTEVLQAPVDDIWEACKHADKILCDLMPEYFAKSELVQGHGEPGSIRVITMGPAVPHAGQVKERMDKFDEATKTLGYTVLQGDPRYSAFSAEMQFVAGKQDGTTDGIWTAKYTPVGDMGPPVHVQAIATMVMKTLERSVNSKETLTHTETLEGTPDAIWAACKNADEILCKSMPQFFASSTFLHGHGEPGSVRVVKMGPAIPFAGEVTERMDMFDDAARKLGYTVLKGDPRYRHLSATMQFTAGPREGATTATWVATYVPKGDVGPPEHVKAIVVLVWKALSGAATANAHGVAAQNPNANPISVQQ